MTSAAAMVVTLPGQFSTITCQPSDSVSSFETMRLTMSGGVLAENKARISRVVRPAILPPD